MFKSNLIIFLVFDETAELACGNVLTVQVQVILS